MFNLFKDKAIASKATTELLTHPLILEENEVLKAQAADANELHVIASILEINRDYYVIYRNRSIIQNRSNKW